MVGCVAMHILKTLNLSDFQNGQIVTKQLLKRLNILECPYAFIKKYGFETIGVSDLPKSMFGKDYVFPNVNSQNISEKIQAIEGILQEYGIDISLNFYVLANMRVYNDVISSEKTVTATRSTASVRIGELSCTKRPRRDISSFNILIGPVSDTQLHCWLCLDIGKFMYYNIERFFYDKGPEELVKLVKLSADSLTSSTIDGELKRPTGNNVRSATRAIYWQSLHVCKACATAFARLAAFQKHIKKCVGGKMANMEFSVIPHVEHFEEREFPNTLLCPIVASFDTESCANVDITRRVTKNGLLYKSDERKCAEMILVAVVATVIVRPNRKLDYTIYKDLSMSDEELLDFKSTVPWHIHRHLDVEDEANLSSSIDAFRVSMDEFMELKQKVLQSHVDENKISNSDANLSRENRKVINLELEETNKQLLIKRKEVSRRFGVYFMELFQALMEATKKNVAVCQKKTLNLTVPGRMEISRPLFDKVTDLKRKGIVRTEVAVREDNQRDIGFVKVQCWAFRKRLR